MLNHGECLEHALRLASIDHKRAIPVLSSSHDLAQGVSNEQDGPVVDTMPCIVGRILEDVGAENQRVTARPLWSL